MRGKLLKLQNHERTHTKMSIFKQVDHPSTLILLLAYVKQISVHSSRDKHQTLAKLILFFRYYDGTRMGVVVRRHKLGHAMEVVNRSSGGGGEEAQAGACHRGGNDNFPLFIQFIYFCYSKRFCVVHTTFCWQQCLENVFPNVAEKQIQVKCF